MIVGRSGSGKSTLACALGQRSGLPVAHTDHLQLRPGWISRSRAARTTLALDAEAQERRSFESNLSETYANRIARRDTLIWLDLPVTLRRWRVTWRLIRYWGRQRSDMAPGCREGFHRETRPYYEWIWDTRNMARAGIVRLFDNPPAHLRVVHDAACLGTVPPCH